MQKFEILTPTGFKKFDGVRCIEKMTIGIKYTNGIVYCTPDHRFIINGKEVLAASLKPGNKISKKNKIISVFLHQVIKVYDPINVDGGHVFLHDHEIISHNCTFLGSSMTLLSGSTLARLTHDIPIKEYTDQYKGMKVYQHPEKHKQYSMCVDVSRGRHLDNSAFIVFDITTYPHRMVCTYKNNEIPPLLYASLIQKVGLAYNTAYLLIEINDIGAQVADVLWNDLEYEEMFWSKSGDILGKTGADPYPGIRTTKKTKRIGCANLKDVIDNNQLIVNDADVIHELSTFIQSKTASYEADEGFKDDLVMCCVLHAWLVSQPWFNELTDSDLRTTMHNTHVKELEDQICMVGGYSDGVDEAEERELVETYPDRMVSWNNF